MYNFNKLEAIFVSDYGRDSYCVRIGINQDSAVIGTYSTEEKAIKVLDMIQKAYNSIETMKIDKEAWRDNHYFQMPQDSEI